MKILQKHIAEAVISRLNFLFPGVIIKEYNTSENQTHTLQAKVNREIEHHEIVALLELECELYMVNHGESIMITFKPAE